MGKIDIKKQILSELINNPTVSNKALSTKLKVSEPTIARYKKQLSEEKILYQFSYVNNASSGTAAFSARKMYVVYFAEGITRKQVADIVRFDSAKRMFFNKHLLFGFAGDSGGRVALVLILESRVRGDFVDILNGEVLPLFTSKFGGRCIHNIVDVDLEETLRVLHNYEGDDLKVVDKNSIFVSDVL